MLSISIVTLIYYINIALTEKAIITDIDSVELHKLIFFGKVGTVPTNDPTEPPTFVIINNPYLDGNGRSKTPHVTAGVMYNFEYTIVEDTEELIPKTRISYNEDFSPKPMNIEKHIGRDLSEKHQHAEEIIALETIRDNRLNLQSKQDIPIIFISNLPSDIINISTDFEGFTLPNTYQIAALLASPATFNIDTNIPYGQRVHELVKALNTELLTHHNNYMYATGKMWPQLEKHHVNH